MSDIRPYIFDNIVYDQVNSLAPVSPSFYFFSIGATFSTPGDFNAATAVFPGTGSPQSLPLLDPLRFDFGSQHFSSLAALHSSYGFGTYTVTATGSQPTSSVSLSYQADHFAQNTVPYIINYNALNGFDPTKDFTVVHNAFTPDPQTTGFEFFYIWDDAHHLVFKDEFDSASNTTSLIQAGTLAPNTHYTFELDFSDRFGFSNGEEGFDLRTDGAFATGAGSPPSAQTLLDLDNKVYYDNPSLPSHLLQFVRMPDGWQLLAQSAVINSDGFFAEAFQDANGNTVISFCGSIIDPGRNIQSRLDWASPWAFGSRAADLTILKSGHPHAFDDALSFTHAVIDQFGLNPNKVFLSGHSLGGAEAEYVASTLPGIFQGASFGAPGIFRGPERPATAYEFNFKNYIDLGDPVGNYNDHYGQNVYLGNLADKANADLIDRAATKLLSDAIPDPLLTPFLVEIAVTTRLNVADILQQHHALTQYDALI